LPSYFEKALVYVLFLCHDAFMRTSDREIFTNAHLLIQQHGFKNAQALSVRKILDMEKQCDVLGMVMWQRVSAAVDALSIQGPTEDDVVN